MDHVGKPRQFDLSTEFKVGTQWLEKQCGQDGENLLGHVKETTHSSAAKRMPLRGYFKQQGQENMFTELFLLLKGQY